ncbi:phosphatase domain-containing protein [Mycobacterium sp. shizuoka-1]|uniref:phosphatase domain-containing protein n=1 Tax=Mycobacterium sp. shizuoka-1 TaxID=2039281 RepID=UPI000C05F949|nr:phosphatase domain-containing protein [Mycobacterium sp. shizuoka-1]GAY13299.1 phosphatase [Mycobacterium sp. shizuoka-1]
MPRLPRRITPDLSALLRSPETAAVVAGLESKLTERRRGYKVQSGAFRGVRVVVYRGFVADDVAKVRVRVIETPELPGDSRIPYWDVAQSNVRRHAALSIVGAEVELWIGRHRATEVTDSHGFATFALPVPKLRVGWHAAEAVASGVGDEPAVGAGWVVKPSLAAPFLVISDIDDTILLTGLTEGLTMVARTLLRDVEERTAIPGMAALYRGLARGVSGRTGKPRPAPTFVYVSTGSWSFYSMLERFVELRGFPPGPMFLTDWGPTERYLRRSGAEHKRAAVRRLFEAYPGMRFVLIGDSGQRDALIYEEMAREFPGRVRLAMIRQVGGDDDERNARLRDHAETLRDDGIPLHLVADAAHAAELAHAMRLVDRDTVADVRTELDDL